MNRLLTVIKFELGNYFKNRSYKLTTVLITLLMIIGICVPTFMDVFGVGQEENTSPITNEGIQSPDHHEEEKKDCIVYYDQMGIFKDPSFLEESFLQYTWKACGSEEEVRQQVKNGEAKFGYFIKNQTEYVYIVNNKKIYDYNETMLSEVLKQYMRVNYMVEHKLNVEEMEQVLNTPVISNTEILGKDGEGSYFYCYILIFVIYLLILIYGQLIAVGVTSEKSNRAIEVLVTSTSSNTLIFGKVIAGTIASVVQVGVILIAGLTTYHVTRDSWNGMLDVVFRIPAPVLATFAVFGFFGFLFYCFIYGALGAMVSKTEDVSKAISPVMVIFIAGFMVAMMGLNNSDSILVKITSFIPFTSCYTMMIRVAMGSVHSIEIILSLLILLASTMLVGVIGAKIYRMGTLHYGNPMKLSTVLKRIKKEKN